MTATSILVVEDESIIAKGIEKRLKGMGYAVSGLASTGEGAVQKAVDLRPDIVLMDIYLGKGMDGIEAGGQIRSKMGLPIVYLTAHSDEATLQRAKLTEPFGYVLKPYEDKDLQTAIEIGLYKHKMDRRARENEEWLAATLGSIGDGVIATDEQGRVRYMNALAEQLTGWKLADALGKDLDKIFPIVDEKSRQPVHNPALAALTKGQSVTLAPNTVLTDRSGGERLIDDSAAPIRGPSGNVTGSVLVFRDITDRRKLEEQVRQAHKMEAIGRLAGGIAHDFNNIMTIITGFSELLMADRVTASERNDLLGHIYEAGKRAASLTQQIVAFSRKQILLPCVLHLNSVVRDTGVMVRRLIGSHIELVIHAAHDLGHVKADPSQIGQVILNLAVNARDAMPPPAKGKLVISTANVWLGEQSAQRQHDMKPGGYARLTISDTGSGMTQEVLDHIFEPFFTTKSIGQGSGLGLAMVYGIVKQSGGHIEALSQPGAGSTFSVYLPLIDDIDEPQKPQAPPQAAIGQQTILLVEDEDAVRRMTKMILQKCGYHVLDASSGQKAVAIAAEHTGPIHLLITDLVMPIASGLQVARQLTALKRVTRVLFISGYSEDSLGDLNQVAATTRFLPKPFGLADLTEMVQELLDPACLKSAPSSQ